MNELHVAALQTSSIGAFNNLEMTNPPKGEKDIDMRRGTRAIARTYPLFTRTEQARAGQRPVSSRCLAELSMTSPHQPRLSSDSYTTLPDNLSCSAQACPYGVLYILQESAFRARKPSDKRGPCNASRIVQDLTAEAVNNIQLLGKTQKWKHLAC